MNTTNLVIVAVAMTQDILNVGSYNKTDKIKKK